MTFRADWNPYENFRWKFLFPFIFYIIWHIHTFFSLIKIVIIAMKRIIWFVIHDYNAIIGGLQRCTSQSVKSNFLSLNLLFDHIRGAFSFNFYDFHVFYIFFVSRCLPKILLNRLRLGATFPAVSLRNILFYLDLNFSRFLPLPFAVSILMLFSALLIMSYIVLCGTFFLLK
jgi:hypothetical protein